MSIRRMTRPSRGPVTFANLQKCLHFSRDFRSVEPWVAARAVVALGPRVNGSSSAAPWDAKFSFSCAYDFCVAHGRTSSVSA